jgi:hypothetical protein
MALGFIKTFLSSMTVDFEPWVNSAVHLFIAGGEDIIQCSFNKDVITF